MANRVVPACFRCPESLRVERGMARRGHEEVAYAGMDEKAFLKGKKAGDFACVMVDL